MVCVDPHNAGDIITSDQFDWFELRSITTSPRPATAASCFMSPTLAAPRGRPVRNFNSKTMRRQKTRNVAAGLWAVSTADRSEDRQNTRCHQPVGQWNHVRLLISPDKCVHEINGVKYFEYVLHSEIQQPRRKSKFGKMEHFAKFDRGQSRFKAIMARFLSATSRSGLLRQKTADATAQKNGLCAFSSPTVVSGPCPAQINVSAGK